MSNTNKQIKDTFVATANTMARWSSNLRKNSFSSKKRESHSSNASINNISQRSSRSLGQLSLSGRQLDDENADKNETISLSESNLSPQQDSKNQQIAGHQSDKYNRSRIMFNGDEVYKLFDRDDADGRGLKEVEFYEHVEEKFPELFGKILPKYLGHETFKEEAASKEGEYLILENILKGLTLEEADTIAGDSDDHNGGTNTVGNDLDTTTTNSITELESSISLESPHLETPNNTTETAYIATRACLADIKIGKPTSKFERKPLFSVPSETSSPLPKSNATPREIKRQKSAPTSKKAPLGMSTFLNKVVSKTYTRMTVPSLQREGFQFLGIKVKNLKTGQFEKYGKFLGRCDRILGIDYILEKFLSGADVDGKLDSNFPDLKPIRSSNSNSNSNSQSLKTIDYLERVINDLLSDLSEIENWLSTQTTFIFRGSSLILSYLAHEEKEESQKTFNQSPPPPKTAIVRLIDFNNVTINENGQEIDQVSLNGVKKLKTYLEATKDHIKV